jgi:hypothetical protein
MKNILLVSILFAPCLSIAQSAPTSQPTTQQASPLLPAVPPLVKPLRVFSEEGQSLSESEDPIAFQGVYQRSLYTMFGLFGASAASYGAVLLFGRSADDATILVAYGLGQGLSIAAAFVPQAAYAKKGEAPFGRRLLLRRLLIPSALGWSSALIASRTYEALQPPCTPKGFDFSCVDFRGFSIFMGTLTAVANVGRLVLSSKHMLDLKNGREPKERRAFSLMPMPLLTPGQNGAALTLTLGL